MAMTNVDHFELPVSDFDRSIDFYGRMGVEIEEPTSGPQAREGRRRVFLRLGNQQVNLVTPESATAPSQPAPGSAHVAFAWRGTMEEYLDQLTRNGLSPRDGRGPTQVTGAQGPGTRIFVLDPDGNSIEVVAYP